MSKFKDVLDKELILIEEYKNIEDAFEKIGDILYKKGYVTDEFVENLVKREKEHPTGMDLSPVFPDMDNIAIPHTESKYSTITKIVVVKLNKKLLFRDMIDKNKEIEVKYMFIILNKQGEAQANLLSTIIEFATNKENMQKLNNANNEISIYEALLNNN